MTFVLDVELSLSRQRWVQRGNLNPEFERLVLAVSQRNSLPEIVARAIVARKVNLDEVEGYLHPTLKELMPDPLLLKGMQQGVDRVVSSIRSGKVIGLFADYDVDGATSAALLINFFSAVQARSKLYIPDRMKEGYGPNEIGLKKLVAEGADLIVTLDCGILAFEVLGQAAEDGLDVVIIDHHMAEAILPKAVAVINPNRLDDVSNLGELAAVGVTFLFVVALNRKLRQCGWYNDKPEPRLLKWLDLVALGTVCDVMPLKGLNRAFVSQGLKVLANRENIGLRALADVSKVEQRPNSYQLGFVLGPRINAGGRVGQSDIGARLLSTDNFELADTLAKTLDANNSARKEIEAKVLTAAIEEVEQSNRNENVIVVAGDNWHPGVIGIIAGRLREKFNKPACVISFNGATGKGSGRSVPNWQLGACIISGVQSNILTTGGGHGMAAGFVIERGKLKDFKKFINDRFIDDTHKQETAIDLKLDGVLTINGANKEVIETLALLEPFGAGNPEPVFALRSVMVAYSAVVGENHIQCTLRSIDGITIKGIAFRALNTEVGDALLNHGGRTFHIAGKIRENNWQGKKNLQIIIDDVASIALD